MAEWEWETGWQIGVRSKEEIAHVCVGKRGAGLKGKTSHFTGLSEVTEVAWRYLNGGGDCRFHKTHEKKLNYVSLNLFWSWLCSKAGKSQKRHYFTCNQLPNYRDNTSQNLQAKPSTDMADKKKTVVAKGPLKNNKDVDLTSIWTILEVRTTTWTSIKVVFMLSTKLLISEAEFKKVKERISNLEGQRVLDY